MITENKLNQVIKGIGDNGSTGNIMEILHYKVEEFQEGFDLALTMQNMDLIKLLYSNFNQNKIIVEFTLLGKARYRP